MIRPSLEEEDAHICIVIQDLDKKYEGYQILAYHPKNMSIPKDAQQVYLAFGELGTVSGSKGGGAVTEYFLELHQLRPQK